MRFVIENLSLLNNHRCLFENFNLTINPGEIWGVLGKNGVGKTTLLQGICGIRKPAFGKISFQATTPLEITSKTCAKYVGLLQQETEYFFPLSVKDVVLAGRYPHHAHSIFDVRYTTKNDMEILHQVLLDLELTELAERNVMELSGGEKRRASIGMLLAQQPTLYLLDEPCNHLDIYHQVKVLNIFKNLAAIEKKMVIIVTHDLNIAANYCDNIILCFDDKTLLSGDRNALMTEANLSRLYNHPIHKLSHAQYETWVLGY